MNKEKAIETIRKKFLEEYKFIYKKEERIAFFRNLIKLAEESNLEDYAKCFYGYTEWVKDNFKEAEKSFKQSIELNQDLAYSWNGLGYVYDDLNEYEKAIKCYNKAIKIDKNYAGPWNNLGIVYSKLKEYEKAIEYYNKSINIDENYTYPWNNLGIVYWNLKEYDKAIECYNEAIKIDNKNSAPYFNLGLIYLSLEKWEDAKKNFETALELYKKGKDEYWISRTESFLKEVDNTIESEKALEDKISKKDEDPIAQIFEESKEIEKDAGENEKKFKEFLKQDKAKDAGIYFQVLRRWNSYTPIIADNYHISKGGGYFLKINGKGIVIDPGFNFIDNFKGAGHFFNEIDIILISHAHNDHTADLESILTLLNEYNEKVKGLEDLSGKDTIRDEIAKKRRCAPDKITPEEIEKEFLKSPKRKTIDIYLTQSTNKKYSGLIDLFSPNYYFTHIVENGDKKDLIGEKDLTVIEAKHNDVISDKDSVGFILRILDTVLIYTGDTGWNKDIAKQYKNISKGDDYIKSKYKILLAHIGGIKAKERDYFSPKKEIKEKALYENHLGRIGISELVKILKPDTCFISEFGEELKGNRIKLAAIFQKSFSNTKPKTKFFPADIGFKFNFKEKKIEAIKKLDFEKYKSTPGCTNINDVNTCLLRKDYSLHYFDKMADFTESDLIQVLIENFEESTR